MTKIKFYAILCINTMPLFPFAQSFEWAKSIGGDYSDRAYAVATDDMGNVYSTGSFRLTADFDPGDGIFELTASGSEDMFVLKLNAAGDFVWAVRMGGTSAVRGRSLNINSDGHIIITGDFFESVDFDPGSGDFTLTSVDGGDMHVVILDEDGNLVSAGAMGGEGFQYSSSVSTNTDGHIFIGGYFGNSSDFDPGAGEFSVTVGEGSLFVVELNALGEFVWMYYLEGNTSSDIKCWDMTLDSAGNILLVGGFSGSVDFDSGAGEFVLTSTGSYDIYVCKIDGEGNFLWAAGMGNGSADSAQSVTTDDADHVLITGTFLHSVDFDPGVETLLLTSQSTGAVDVFVWKLDSNGELIWAKSIGGNDTDISSAIDVDAQGNVYIGGAFEDDCDFDPGANVTELTPDTPGTFDAFIAVLNVNGEYVWAGRIGGPNVDQGQDLVVDANGNIYSCGYFDVTADMDPSSNVAELTAIGGDLYVHKMNALSNDLSENSTTSAVRIYPNPSMNHIHISGIEGNPNYDIFNEQGQWLFSTKNKIIHIDRLQRGVYYLRINAAEKNEMLQFVKE